MKKLLILTLLLSLFMSSAKAEYADNSTDAIAISGAAPFKDIGKLKIAVHENGNTYIAWQQIEVADGASSIATHLQLLDKLGNMLWGETGVLIPSSNSIYNLHDIDLAVTKGAEAIISVVGKIKNEIEGTTLHKINANKTFAWGDNGKTIFSDTNNGITDGAKLAINRNNNLFACNISSKGAYIQKISNDGAKLYDADIFIEGKDLQPVIIPSNGDSLIVVYRANNTLFADLYNGQGKMYDTTIKNRDTVINGKDTTVIDTNVKMVAWRAKYLGNTTGEELKPADPQFVLPDGSGGIIAVWQYQVAENKQSIAVQRINSKGNRLFSDDGIGVSTAPGSHTMPVVSVDTVNRMIYVAWKYTYLNKNSIMLQKIHYPIEKEEDDPDYEGSGMGEILWGDNGLEILDKVDDIVNNHPVAVASIENGRVMVAVSQKNASTSEYELHAMRIDENQNIEWRKPLYTKQSKQYSPVCTGFFANQIVVSWYDKNTVIDSPDNMCVKAQNITYNGVLGKDNGNIDEKLKYFNINVYPHPVSNKFSVGFELDMPQIVSVKLFDMSGKLVADFGMTYCQFGHNELNLSQELTSGSYLLQLNFANITSYKLIVK